MTILKISGLLIGVILLSGFIKGMYDITTHTTKGTVQDYLDNKFNERNYLQGTLEEGNAIFDELIKLDKPQVETLMNERDLNLHEISWTVYIWAMRHIQEGNIQQGVYILHIAADDYLNPLAITKLAKVYYHGPEALDKTGKLKLEKDLDKSFDYVHLAYSLIDVVKDMPAGKKSIDLFVNNGLGLMDTFHGMEINGKINRSKMESKFQESWTEKVEQYRKMYF